MKQALRWMVCILVLASLSGAARAQSTNSGDIRGTVTDSSGGVLPDVAVTITNVDTGVSTSVTTNREGVYDSSSIVAGNYTITFVRQGFEKFVRGPITLEVGLSTVNAALKVGSTTEEVTVTTDIPLLQTETGDKTETLDSKTMAQLPQVTQDWENFMILLPGTSGPPGNTSAGQVVSSNGNLPYSNILQDGASTTLSHSQNANPAIFESVSELQVSLSSFSAQYGIGGMIINQISKGGTNQFHGSAYDYLQNDFLNSRQYVYNSIQKVPLLRYNNFGGSIGGPVLKNRMFFYFNYDRIIDHGGASNSTQSVPTASVMAGDFNGETRTIYDPTTQTIAYDSKGNPYPVRQSFQSEYGSNAIPSGLIDPVAANFQKFYPTQSSHIPNGNFATGYTNSLGILQNNWYSSVPQSTPYIKYFGRLDYDLNSKNRITMSDTQSDTPVVYPNSVTANPIGWQSGDVDNNNAQITDVWTISPTLVNEARLGYTWQGNFFDDLSLGHNYPTELGWQFAKANTIPAIQFTNTYPYAWIDPSSNAVYKEHVFDPSDVVTLIKGKHILHFGGEVLIYQDNSTAWGNINAGTFQFSGQYTQQWTLDSNGVAHANTSGSGIEYADFLLGLAQNWNASVSPEYGGRLKSPQFFVQDDFKLRPNLTINAGVRYQINHGWSEVKGNIDGFDPTVPNPATGANGAYWYASTHANGRTALMQNVWDTVLPRVGFSWLMNPATTIRGGFGLYSYNWSLDTYGTGMGAAVSSSGGTSDQTNGVTPITKLGGPGTIYGTTTPLPYTAASTDPARYNGQGAYGSDYHEAVPKIYQWNFAIQRQVGHNYVLEMAYIASHGYNLAFPTDIDAVPADHLTPNGAQYRPYPQYQGISWNTHNALSNYNSLQVSATKRLTNGVSFSGNYVWSHFLDDQDSSGWGGRSGPQNIQIANNPKANYGNSGFDARNVAKGYVVYVLPFGRGQKFLNNNSIVDAAIGGWQISSTIVLSSGHPFTVFADGNTYQLSGSQYPNANPGISWHPLHRSNDEWYNPAAFIKPPDGTFGNVKRNSLYGPGFSQVNLSGSKTFSLPWEGIKFQIRADANNALNHISYANPGATGLTNPDANGVYQGPVTGQITGAQLSGRNVQLGGRLTF